MVSAICLLSFLAVGEAGSRKMTQESGVACEMLELPERDGG